MTYSRREVILSDERPGVANLGKMVAVRHYMIKEYSVARLRLYLGMQG